MLFPPVAKTFLKRSRQFDSKFLIDGHLGIFDPLSHLILSLQ